MKKILQQKEKVLRQIAHEVHIREIKTTKIKKVLKEMSVALKSQSDGVAIAAPQIGYSLRIFVFSGKIFLMNILSVVRLLLRRHSGSLEPRTFLSTPFLF